ncbi:3TM-type holin [uncultured Microbulbifer sp.]|uniref:3TM-type holin n=1 Tax=uncultured Microbulbifer sp. TaxID=348147 RepID=UPI0026356029|nr:3TM-type holin [uncultured Microbulbifer sp.]
MSFDPLTALFDAGKMAIERIWPDPIKRVEEVRKLEELKQKGEMAALNAQVQLLLGQLEVNKAEAQHKSVFVAGWRPAVGWICASCLGLAFIPKAMALTGVWIYHCIVLYSGFDPSLEQPLPAIPAYPDLGLTDVLGILGGMLGMGAMRSIDKRTRAP